MGQRSTVHRPPGRVDGNCGTVVGSDLHIKGAAPTTYIDLVTVRSLARPMLKTTPAKFPRFTSCAAEPGLTRQSYGTYISNETRTQFSDDKRHSLLSAWQNAPRVLRAHISWDRCFRHVFACPRRSQQNVFNPGQAVLEIRNSSLPNLAPKMKREGSKQNLQLLPGKETHFASFAAAVVLPVPCRPAMRITVGFPSSLRASGACSAPITAISSSFMTFMNCCCGVTPAWI